MSYELHEHHTTPVVRSSRLHLHPPQSLSHRHPHRSVVVFIIPPRPKVTSRRPCSYSPFSFCRRITYVALSTLLRTLITPPLFASALSLLVSRANSTSIPGRVRSSRHPSVLSFASIVVIRHHRRPSHTRVDILINISDHRDYSSLPVTLLSSCRRRSSSS